MAAAVTLGIVDDDRMLRESLALWLAQELAFEVTVTGASLGEVLDSAPAEVTLLDVNLRDGSDPADNVERLREWGTRVVVVSTIPDPEFVLATIRAGAWAYVTKSSSVEDLVSVIRATAAGDHAVSTDLAHLMTANANARAPRVSARQRDVARLYASGLPMKSVARRLGISIGTAHEHLRRLKAAYAEAGRPAHSKLDVAQRLREDRLELKGLADGTESSN